MVFWFYLFVDQMLLQVMFSYEAQMTLFLRMSQSSGGADHLLESNIIEALSECRFLGMLPESDIASGILQFITI
jgi:hypothetical protein